MGPGGQVTITPDQPAQQSGGPVTITPDQPSSRGFFSNLWGDVKAMPGNAYKAITAPDPMSDPSVSDADKSKLVQQSEDEAAARIQNREQQGRGKIYSNIVAPAGEMMGVNVPGAEKSWDEKDYAGVAGHLAAVPAVMAATEGISRLPLGRIAESVGAVAKPFRVTAEDLPVVGSVVKGAKAFGKVPGELADIWAKRPDASALGDLPPTGARPAAETGEALGQPGQAGSIADSFQDPGAPLPAKPSLELQQGSALLYGPQKVVDPAAGLGQISVRNPGQAGSIADSMKPQTSAPSPEAAKQLTRKSLSEMLDTELRKGVGAAPPPDPTKPIYQRGSLANSVQGESPDMLEGHTPVQSSWIKSYKYDPQAREFEMAPKSGTPVRLGDVDPEEAEAFGDAKSQGKAWQQIKNNPLVAKRVNGKWQPVTSGPRSVSPQ